MNETSININKASNGYVANIYKYTPNEDLMKPGKSENETVIFTDTKALVDFITEKLG